MAHEAKPSSEKDRQPTLKVMRLYKSKLYLNSDLPRDPIIASIYDVPSFSLSSSLLLPDSFGTIHLGETFSSYISVINHFPYDLYNVSLTARIQSPNGRSELRDMRKERTGQDPPSNPIDVFPAGSNLDMIIQHNLSEIGVHTLRVGVSYATSAASPAESLRKFYRFNVLSPVTISYNHLTIQNDPFVEATFQNASQVPMYIESIEFQPQMPFVVVKTPTYEKPQVETDELLKYMDPAMFHVLQPEETLQRVYRIRHQDGIRIQGTVNFGRVEIQWKTALGEAGRLQSNSISRKMPLVNEIEIRGVNLPPSIQIGIPCPIELEILNQSDSAFHLHLELRRDKMKGIFCSSVSNLDLDVIPPFDSKKVSVEALPLLAGYLEFRGIVLVERSTGREFPMARPIKLLVN